MAANILREGGIYGIQIQPYESHIDQFMHFFGDYCLGGNEYIKLNEFKIRHMPNISQTNINLQNATHFPLLFSKIINENRNIKL